jgi:hypothetical protein
MRIRIGGLVAASALVFAVGCGKGGGGSKCEQAVNKGMEMAGQMMAAMAGDKAAEAKAEMDKQKPEAIKKCEAALKDDKDGKAAKALDCIIAAKDIEAMMKCEGADAVMQ